MDAIVEFTKENASWIFSGIGVAILTGIFYVIRTLIKRESSQIQRVSTGSLGVQAGRDANVHQQEKKQ